MVVIPLTYTGPIKRDLVKEAYGQTGLNDAEFEISPEEMVRGLDELNGMMAEWAEDGIDLGYDQPEYGSGRLEGASGIPVSAKSAVVSYLALRLAPGMGATLSVEARAALTQSYTRLQSRYATIPTRIMRSHTPRGAGNRRGNISGLGRFVSEASFVEDDGTE